MITATIPKKQKVGSIIVGFSKEEFTEGNITSFIKQASKLGYPMRSVSVSTPASLLRLVEEEKVRFIYEKDDSFNYLLELNVNGGCYLRDNTIDLSAYKTYIYSDFMQLVQVVIDDGNIVPVKSAKVGDPIIPEAFDIEKDIENIKKIMSAMTELLEYKHRKYMGSALHPDGVFDVGDALTTIKVRINDKIKRIKNSNGNPPVNDISDDLGYHVLYLVGMNGNVDETVQAILAQKD